MSATLWTTVGALATALALRPRARARRIVDTSPTPYGPRRWVPHVRRSRPSGPPRPATVASWCESLARSIRSGSSLTEALRSNDTPQGADEVVAPVLLAVQRGARLADALDVTTESPHLNLAITVLRACAVNGGSPAEPLDRAAATLRSRAAAAEERRTHSAQARLSAVVMTVLPVAMLALLLATSSSTRAATVGPSGLVVVAAGAALNLAGWRWMRRIIDGVLA